MCVVFVVVIVCVFMHFCELWSCVPGEAQAMVTRATAKAESINRIAAALAQKVSKRKKKEKYVIFKELRYLE